MQLTTLEHSLNDHFRVARKILVMPADRAISSSKNIPPAEQRTVCCNGAAVLSPVDHHFERHVLILVEQSDDKKPFTVAADYKVVASAVGYGNVE